MCLKEGILLALSDKMTPTPLKDCSRQFNDVRLNNTHKSTSNVNHSNHCRYLFLFSSSLETVDTRRVLLFLEESVYNFLQAGGGSNHQTHYGNHTDDDVLYDHPGFVPSMPLVPVGASLNQSRESDSQCRQAESTEQRNEQLQVGNGNGQ